MTTWAITRSFNEADIIESSIRRMLQQVDRVVVGDNSTDGTEKVLAKLAAEFGERLDVRWDNAPSVAQREVMTEYARDAGRAGAEWVVPFDIDEVWFADQHPIRNRLAQLPESVLLVPARLVTHCATVLDDMSDPDPLSRMGWRDAETLPLPKVACRPRPDLVIEHGNHAARYESVRFPPAVMDVLAAHHFPYRSPEQLTLRVRGAWPQLRDSGLPETHGAHMWAYGRLLDARGEDGMRDLFNEHMLFTDPERQGRVFDPLPRVELPLSVPA